MKNKKEEMLGIVKDQRAWEVNINSLMWWAYLGSNQGPRHYPPAAQSHHQLGDYSSCWSRLRFGGLLVVGWWAA